MSGVSKLAEKLIADNMVMIFSKSYCPYCTKAKKVFSDLKTQFNSFELNESEDGDAIQSYLAEKTGQKTVPMIFIGQHFVGGSDDLGRLAASNELKKMLKL